MLCKDCPRRKDCRELCARAQARLKKDTPGKPDWLEFVDPQYLDWLGSQSPFKSWELEAARLGPKEWRVLKKCGLTKRQLECARMYYWQGKTQDQIARRLGIARQVACKHLKYARKKIWACLGEGGEDTDGKNGGP